ncbi:plasmid partitioning protein RepA [Sinorhizobium meliloti]|uniref:plasmid partitioning protein RepA n=2 Tax=Rhizobium meliloti TaxID=382 RepID=UPI000FDCBAB1|nr:plasmid partitioning protein RepA [Sinorhizobium meliloti]RVP05296.1 plasmid partitioning protein RepA [Sinorhizobium meliloti]
MPQTVSPPHEKERTSERIRRRAKELFDRVRASGVAIDFPFPDPMTLRSFSLGEVAEILGVSHSYLRQLSIDGLGPTPELGTAGRRSYTLRQINELRAYLASARPKDALKFYPRRREGEKLQIISVGGSASTTTAFYLVQGLALQGFRVLAVDLDRRGSFSGMFGYTASTTPVYNKSIYAALRCDDDRASIRTVIRPTHFDGLDIVPGSIELRRFEEERLRRYLSGASRNPDANSRLVSAIEEVEGNYDVVVIAGAPVRDGLGPVALEAATGVLVTVHPQLDDVASTAMSLSIFSEYVRRIEEAGKSEDYDFFKFLVTRHDPRDVAEQETIALLRGSLGDDLLTAIVWESDAIGYAGLKNRSLYELSAGAVGRSAYEQAMETLNSVNAEVMDIISEVWGRPPIYVSQASRSTTAGKAKSQSKRLPQKELSDFSQL